MTRVAELQRGDRGGLAGLAPVLFALCPVSPLRDDPDGRVYCGDGEAFLSLCRMLGVRCDVAACNRAIEQWPFELRHAISLHGDMLFDREIEGRMRPGFVDQRRRAGHPCAGLSTHGTMEQPGVDFVWRFFRSVPSSGGLACLVGGLPQCLGYELVVTNARLSAPGYERYLRPWRDCKRQGLLPNVACFTPMSGPGLLNGLLGGVTPEMILAAARRDEGEAA